MIVAGLDNIDEYKELFDSLYIPDTMFVGISDTLIIDTRDSISHTVKVNFITTIDSIIPIVFNTPASYGLTVYLQTPTRIDTAYGRIRVVNP